MLVRVTSFPSEESRMTTWDFIIALFYHIDRQMHAMPKHPEAHLWPSEVVTLGLLHALKGVGNRPILLANPEISFYCTIVKFSVF